MLSVFSDVPVACGGDLGSLAATARSTIQQLVSGRHHIILVPSEFEDEEEGRLSLCRDTLTDVPDISAAVEAVRSAVNAVQELGSQLSMAAAGGVEDDSAFIPAPASASQLPAISTDKAPDACVSALGPRRQVAQLRGTEVAVEWLDQARLRCSQAMYSATYILGRNKSASLFKLCLTYTRKGNSSLVCLKLGTGLQKL